MSWSYQGSIAVDPISGEFIEILRPEIPIRVHGPTGSRVYQALVDSGADYTVFPQSMADALGITTFPAKGGDIIGVGG